MGRHLTYTTTPVYLRVIRSTEPSGPARLEQRTNLGLQRSERTHQVPTHLKDYICYGGHSTDPSPTLSSQHISSGTPYPIVNFVTCTNFSFAYKQFLAVITKVAEPRHYHEATQNPLWRKAIELET